MILIIIRVGSKIAGETRVERWSAYESVAGRCESWQKATIVKDDDARVEAIEIAAATEDLLIPISLYSAVRYRRTDGRW